MERFLYSAVYRSSSAAYTPLVMKPFVFVSASTRSECHVPHPALKTRRRATRPTKGRTTTRPTALLLAEHLRMDTHSSTSNRRTTTSTTTVVSTTTRWHLEFRTTPWRIPRAMGRRRVMIRPLLRLEAQLNPWVWVVVNPSRSSTARRINRTMALRLPTMRASPTHMALQLDPRTRTNRRQTQRTRQLQNPNRRRTVGLQVGQRTYPRWTSLIAIEFSRT